MPNDETSAHPAATPEQPIVTIEGERVALGPLRPRPPAALSTLDE